MFLNTSTPDPLMNKTSHRINRRFFLRSARVTLALPLLESLSHRVLGAGLAVGTIKKLDADQGRIVVTAKGKDYTLTVGKDVKVLGADGTALADGIKSTELKEGAEVTINYARDAGTPALKEIRLGKPPARVRNKDN